MVSREFGFCIQWWSDKNRRKGENPMKVSCTFDTSHRSLVIESEDELEHAILKEICTRTAKGQVIKVTDISISEQINHSTSQQDVPIYIKSLPLRIEIKVNGK
jgi:hypothetical protein